MKLRGEQEVKKHLYYRRRELEKNTEDQLNTITDTTQQSLEDTDSLKALTHSTQEGLL